MLARYRATGADLPLADLSRPHGVALEGCFWRLTDAASGRVVVALCGVNRDAAGRTWGIVGIASHPGGFVRHAVVPAAGWDPDGGVLWAGGHTLRADRRHLRIDLGRDARLSVRFDELAGWPRGRIFGALGLAHVLPALGHYWHPHALGGAATGTAVLGGARVALAGARVYAEKNWSHVGFPDAWWWGQADGFDGDDACVAFAGGDVRVAGRDATATAVVVRAGTRVVRFGNPLTSPVRVRVSDGSWLLRGRSARHSVAIEGSAAPGGACILPIPLVAQRRAVPGALHHLDGRMRVVLRRDGRVVFAGESALAGLERGGCAVAARELSLRRDRVAIAA